MVDHSDSMLRPSILKLLTDPELHRGDRHARVNVEALKLEVKENLEKLLTTFNGLVGSLLDSPLERCRQSVLGYGVPDLAAYSHSEGSPAEEVAKLIRRAVRAFEPRLERDSVRVTLIEVGSSAAGGDPADEGRKMMRFRIEGILSVQPVRQPVAFDTTNDVRDTHAIKLEHA
ncbi:MAG: type VI secretion system baseplate subunit TssE [Planctomycetota bacterium]